ncbi:MAG TPA: hypothetical protein VFD16_00865 [Candidatus Saccharimonadales bacterium]|nr:hypothetical protein [Candidatus Saccharimonadales bacterium]
MKEKILGALLAMAPFKGNAQEGVLPTKDKIAPKIEEAQPVQEDKRLKDKKTVHWNTVLETNISLLGAKEFNNPPALEKSAKIEQVFEKDDETLISIHPVYSTCR